MAVVAVAVVAVQPTDSFAAYLEPWTAAAHDVARKLAAVAAEAAHMQRFRKQHAVVAAAVVVAAADRMD